MHEEMEKDEDWVRRRGGAEVIEGKIREVRIQLRARVKLYKEQFSDEIKALLALDFSNTLKEQYDATVDALLMFYTRICEVPEAFSEQFDEKEEKLYQYGIELLEYNPDKIGILQQLKKSYEIKRTEFANKAFKKKRTPYKKIIEKGEFRAHRGSIIDLLIDFYKEKKKQTRDTKEKKELVSTIRIISEANQKKPELTAEDEAKAIDEKNTLVELIIPCIENRLVISIYDLVNHLRVKYDLPQMDGRFRVNDKLWGGTDKRNDLRRFEETLANA